MKKEGKKHQSKGQAAGHASGPAHRPAAPHGHPLTQAKPEGRAHPAERKAKHKQPPGRDDTSGE